MCGGGGDRERTKNAKTNFGILSTLDVGSYDTVLNRVHSIVSVGRRCTVNTIILDQ